MNDARASHINANQGTIKAVNTSKLNTTLKAVNTSKLITNKVVTSVAAHVYQPPSLSPPPLSSALVPSSVSVTSLYLDTVTAPTVQRVFINPNFNPSRCYEILKSPIHFPKFGSDWAGVLGGEKR
jgi:hypothetical protein